MLRTWVFATSKHKAVEKALNKLEIEGSYALLPHRMVPPLYRVDVRTGIVDDLFRATELRDGQGNVIKEIGEM